MPRPLDLSRFSGVERVGDRLRDRSPRPGRGRGSPAPGTSAGVAVSNSTNTCLAASLRLPCLMALITDSRIATLDPMQRVLVEADAARHVVADHLHEVEHLERAGELEPDDVMAVAPSWTRHAALSIPSLR